MNSFSKKQAFKYGWEGFKKNGWFLVGIILLFYVISFGVSFILSSQEGIGTLIGLLIQWWLSIGVINIFIKLYSNGKVSVKDLFIVDDWKMVWNYILGTILYSLIVLVGIILLVVPGIIWSVKYHYYAYLIIDKKMSPIEAIKMSGRITKGHKGNIFLFLILSTLLSLLGLIVVGIGLLVTVPVVMLASVWIYKWLDSDYVPEEVKSESPKESGSGEEKEEKPEMIIEETVIETTIVEKEEK